MVEIMMMIVVMDGDNDDQWYAGGDGNGDSNGDDQ